MAGIYLHIPFCKVKCHYCDFHFSTNLKGVSSMTEALCKEIALRKTDIPNQEINTIYFGGGTPSILSENEFAEIMESIWGTFQVSKDVEVTVECNPDDLDKKKLISLRKQGVNRLSIGIQSFNDAVLEQMNRAHNRIQALESVRMAKELGFDNITIDLIYGVPKTSLEGWKEDLSLAMSLDVQHISAYCLTIEENTVFGKRHEKGQLEMIPEEETIRQFEYLIKYVANYGFEQYEISNFAKKDKVSRHNSAYWLGKDYLGIGPSAHSYGGNKRSWNIANNTIYIKGIQEGKRIYEEEKLSIKDQFNDYLLTRLRTKWGIKVSEMNDISEIHTAALKKEIQRFIASEMVLHERETFFLTEEGKLMADAISAELFC